MMKKILAMLSAAVLGCCMLTAPAFAADEAAQETGQTYQLGDVDMDGEITARDALIVLRAYTMYLAYVPCELTEQQVLLGDVTTCDSYEHGKDNAYVISAFDAQCILQYYVECMAGKCDGMSVKDYVHTRYTAGTYAYDIKES